MNNAFCEMPEVYKKCTNEIDKKRISQKYKKNHAIDFIIP